MALDLVETRDIPGAYRSGLARGRRIDAPLADRYVGHTMVGDAPADAVIAALAKVPGEQQQDWIRRGLDEGPAAIPDAPVELRDLLAMLEAVPPWFDPADTIAGCRAFHGNSEMFIGAFVGAVLIEGFSTLISKSFSITGRLLDQGVRRLKSNNRHLSEIFLPGGLDREGEGWKLSVRIRLMHARLRALLQESEDWDTAAWGVPLSAAHVGFATAAFSGLLLKRAAALGVALSEVEQDSFMLVWRYAGHLMGVPTALGTGSRDEALALVRVAMLCEPPPDMDAILLANGLVNSAPIVIGITEPAARRRLARRIYAVSRALIGDELADQLQYPPTRGFGVLAALRLRNRLDRLLRRYVPGMEQRRRMGQFMAMMEASFHGSGHGSGALSYRLPRHLHAERDREP